jgi:hypothetical protein
LKERIMFKKWVWSSQGQELHGNRWVTKQTIHVAVVEDTREQAEAFAPGSGVVHECSCVKDSADPCTECMRLYATSPRYV